MGLRSIIYNNFNGSHIYSKYFREYTITDNQLLKLQQSLLMILADFVNVCDKYDINYMICGGTLIGAVRHKGFIPWDDDVDVLMTRDNFEKFRSICFADLNDKYILGCPGDNNYFYKMPKLFLKNSKYVSMDMAGIPDYHMVNIDIFIAENAETSPLLLKIRELLYDFSFLASCFCVDYLYPSDPILEKTDCIKEVKRYYIMRRFLGFILQNTIGMKRFFAICERMARKKKNNGYMCIPSGGFYVNDYLENECFEETVEMDFDGLTVKAPYYYDKYLSGHYGSDYMSIPPKEKQLIHCIIEIKFPGEE